MDDSISEKESLDIIKKMVERARGNLQDGSNYYLLWGWAVLLACVIQYVLIEVFNSDIHWVVWPIAMTLAGIAAGVMGYRQSKKTRYKTFIDNAMMYLWLGFVIFLFLLLALSRSIGWPNSYILIVGLYGFGTFVSGGIINFKPLTIGGLLSIGMAFFAIFASSLFEEFSSILILLAASITVSYLVPGYMLKVKGKANAS